MGWFPFARRGAARRDFVLSLEGVGHSFLTRHLPEGAFPALAALFGDGDLRPLPAALPPVSPAVWATYLTGCAPGRHGVWGRVERRPGSYELFRPTSSDVSVPTLLESLSRAGRTAVAVNVPGTYPPRPIRGVLVAAGRGLPLDALCYPARIGALLRGLGYRDDVDAGPALDGNAEDLMADLERSLRKRFEVAFALLHREPWDFFQLHVSETDRLNHAFWEDYELDAPGRGRAFLSFYRLLDGLAGELLALLPPGVEIVLLSGHGFRRLRREIALNRCLEELGWLEFADPRLRRLPGIGPESRAYSLAPGRVYLHLKGREPRGRIAGREEYRGFREGLAADLLRLRDPDGGAPVVARVIPGEEIAGRPEWGPFPIAVSERQPAPCDLLVVPAEGYGFRGGFDHTTVATRSEMTGAHAYDDAFLFVRGRRIRARAPRLVDVGPTILDLMAARAAERPDGVSLV